MDPRKTDEKEAMDMTWSNRKIRVQARPRAAPRPVASEKAPLKPWEEPISLRIAKPVETVSLPKKLTRKRGFKLPKLPKKIYVGVLCIALLAYGGSHLLKKDSPRAVNGAQTTKGKATLSRDETPKFATILPAGKSIEDFGGWTRVSPPDREPVFAYVDKIGNIPINVSQQPLPEELKEDTEEDITHLALDFHAEEKLTVGDTIVHIGTSAKGPQSIIFAKKDLLILIKSAVKIDNDQWTAYISSLE